MESYTLRDTDKMFMGKMGTVKLESFSKEINQHLFIQAS